MNRIIAVISTLVLAASSAGAQQAFNSLSFGLEAGTTGVGVELAMPVVTDHIVVKLGFNAPSLSYNFPLSLSMDQANASIDKLNAQFRSLGISEQIQSRVSDMQVNLRLVLNLSTVKLMFEYYPFRKSSFHLTFGAYFGMGDNFLSATMTADQSSWDSFTALRDEIDALNAKYQHLEGYTEYNLDDIQYNIGNRTYALMEKDGTAYADASLLVNRARPYFGLGFGRSVPEGHFGFQFDLGVWYHGTPTLSSENEVAYNPSAESLADDISLLDKFILYPQLSLRLIYKIF